MTYLLFLMFGVPAIAIVTLVYFICRMGSQCSREEEIEQDCFGALEGALRDFKPETQPSH